MGNHFSNGGDYYITSLGVQSYFCSQMINITSSLVASSNQTCVADQNLQFVNYGNILCHNSVNFSQIAQINCDLTANNPNYSFTNVAVAAALVTCSGSTGQAGIDSLMNSYLSTTTGASAGTNITVGQYLTQYIMPVVQANSQTYQSQTCNALIMGSSGMDIDNYNTISGSMCNFPQNMQLVALTSCMYNCIVGVMQRDSVFMASTLLTSCPIGTTGTSATGCVANLLPYPTCPAVNPYPTCPAIPATKPGVYCSIM